MLSGKASKYGAEAVLELKPIEGSWVLVESLNFRKYLQKIGVGNRSRDLVMRILLTLRIRQVDNGKQFCFWKDCQALNQS